MDQVSNLIFNALVRRQGVNLPGIGSLNVVSTPAEFKSKGVLIPPMTRVELSSSENTEFESIVAILATQCEIDLDSAMNVYSDWLADCKTENGMIIEAVGQIKQNFFTPSADLNDILNPGGVSSINLPKKSDVGNIAIWIAGAILIGALISTGIIYWLEKRSDISTGTGYDIEVVVNTTTSRTAVQDEATVGQSEAMQTQSSTSTTAQSATQSVSTGTSSPTPSNEPALTTGSTAYYVIVGCYSSDANARKFMESAKKINPQMSYNTLTLNNGKIMIYTSVSASEMEAEASKNVCAKSFEEAWVMKYKVK